VGEPRVAEIHLADGTRIASDLVIVGIGVVPETDWLLGSGVKVENGVVCDATGAASVPGVFAAGDVARWHNPLFGDDRRVEHWTSAAEQAHTVATRILRGTDAPPLASVPYFWSDQFDVKIQFAGRVGPEDEVRVVDGSMAGRNLVALVERDGRTRGVLTVNRPGELVRHRKAIAAR
jgi:NADPH-dependent 2,4-dienoyl-CoA reductase/sulfur reductase-like enzyme